MSQMDSKPSQPGPNMQMNMNNMGMGGGMETGAPPPGTERKLLHTYIYDYFLKHDMLDCAKSMLRAKEAGDINFEKDRTKHEGQMNGVDDDAMDTDNPLRPELIENAKSVNDLPKAVTPNSAQGCYLLEWWFCFMDIYFARSKQGSPSQNAQQYMQQQRLRTQQHFAPQQVMPGGMAGYPPRMMAGPMMANGAMPHDGNLDMKGQNPMARRVMQTMGRAGPGQMNAINRPHMMMQRTDSEVAMNGQQARPQSPATSGASPGIKRQRLENGQYEQIGPNGRGQPGQQPHPGPVSAAQSAQHLLIAHGINPDQLSSHQFQMFQQQPPIQQAKSAQLYAQSLQMAQQKGMQSAMKVMGQTPGQAGSPMMPQTTEGGMGTGLNEFYQPGPGGNMRGAGNMAAGSNIALQDYQMQLILLEQQNKKRLMMARAAEQDNMSHPEGRPGFPQGMSPNRANPSPGPGGKPQVAGTPKMPNQGPGSPLPDGQIAGHMQQRSSPASAAGFNGQMPDGQHMMHNMNMLGAGGAPNGSMMRPSGFSGPMGQPGMEGQMNPNMVRPPQAGRGHPGAGGMWQQPGAQLQPGQAPPGQQPGGPQQAQTPQQIGTPQQARQNIQHGNMPPPQAPPNAGPNRPGAPASPQVTNQQPPTPTQGGKPAPSKKAAQQKQAKRGSQAKKGGAAPPPSAVTPTATSEPPTPTTPQHTTTTFATRPQQNFAAAGGAQNAPTPGGTQPSAAGNAPQNQPAPGAPQQQQQQPPPPPLPQQMDQEFMNIGPGVGSGNNEFGSVGEEDLLLDGFDFDSFLTNGDDSGALTGFAPDMGWTGDGVEAGAGES